MLREMTEMMESTRARIEATRRATRDRTRELNEVDAVTRRISEVQGMVRDSMESESAPAVMQLPAPPPSPIQETAAAPVASPVPTPVMPKRS